MYNKAYNEYNMTCNKYNNACNKYNKTSRGNEVRKMAGVCFKPNRNPHIKLSPGFDFPLDIGGSSKTKERFEL